MSKLAAVLVSSFVWLVINAAYEFIETRRTDVFGRQYRQFSGGDVARLTLHQSVAMALLAWIWL